MINENLMRIPDSNPENEIQNSRRRSILITEGYFNSYLKFINFQSNKIRRIAFIYKRLK